MGTIQRSNGLELAESLIAKRSSKFDLGKFEDGYEVAVRELVDAKLQNLPIPKDEVPQKSSGKVINLMDALRKSVSSETTASPNAKTASPTQKGIGLVKAPVKTASKRRSA
jgi:DNA end-binding protein Ku